MTDKLEHIFSGLIIEAQKFGRVRSEIVFGEGKKDADIMVVGEAPGAEETRLSRPFVGQAGKKFDVFLSALGLSRNQIYITNVVKFRPYNISAKGTLSNRTPNSREIKAMLPYLLSEIETICPKVVVTLGNVALKSLLGADKKIGECHAAPADACALSHSFVLFPLYHPASIIYNRALEPVCREDINKLKLFLERLASGEQLDAKTGEI